MMKRVQNVFLFVFVRPSNISVKIFNVLQNNIKTIPDQERYIALFLRVMHNRQMTQSKDCFYFYMLLNEN